MGREIEVVESWCVGRDFGGEFDYGALYALKDIAAYKAYMLAPLHRQTDEAGLPLESHRDPREARDSCQDRLPKEHKYERQDWEDSARGDLRSSVTQPGEGAYRACDARTLS